MYDHPFQATSRGRSVLEAALRLVPAAPLSTEPVLVSESRQWVMSYYVREPGRRRTALPR